MRFGDKRDSVHRLRRRRCTGALSRTHLFAEGGLSARDSVRRDENRLRRRRCKPAPKARLAPNISSRRETASSLETAFGERVRLRRKRRDALLSRRRRERDPATHERTPSAKEKRREALLFSFAFGELFLFVLLSCALRVTRLRRREREEFSRAERLGARVTLSLGDTRDSVTREIRCTSLGAREITRVRRRRRQPPREPLAFLFFYGIIINTRFQ